MTDAPTNPDQTPATRRTTVKMVAPTESESSLARVLIGSYVTIMLGLSTLGLTAFDGLGTELRWVLGISIVFMVALLSAGCWRGAQASVAKEIPEDASNGFNHMAICGLLASLAGLVVLGVSIYSHVAATPKLKAELATLKETTETSSTRLKEMELELTATKNALSNLEEECKTRARQLEEQIDDVPACEANTPANE